MPDHWRAPFNEAALSSFLVVADTMVRRMPLLDFELVRFHPEPFAVGADAAYSAV